MPKSTTQAITAMKIANILIRFDGTKGKDVSAWLEQVEPLKQEKSVRVMAFDGRTSMCQGTSWRRKQSLLPPV
ncbi:Hypothetical protein FKW44_013090 [Caligus rogercresseyi]|uniref:Uncharacterized protein n=1 Tax=Caligus rogercresseyi TaxID=217165 RepID=A0A7T8HKC1_CALRO|nr:Hypothetical protein FKW44_013090 [Caligus rogercresseyi]